MEHQELQKKHKIVCRLAQLPHKVLSFYTMDNIPSFVLYELCGQECFDLSRAAYLVDNPDFDCLKGVAGFSAEENAEQSYKNPDLFNKYMQQSVFNQKVKGVMQPSALRSGKPLDETTIIISNYLGISNPFCCTWQMKHDNQGMLIYEKPKNDIITDELIQMGACFLGFCPIN